MTSATSIDRPTTSGAPLASDPERRKMMRRNRRRNALSAYGFLTPWLIGVVAITLGPMLVSLYLSFTRYELIGDAEWTGFDNYVRLFSEDPRYLKSVSATITYTVLGVPGILVFSLLLAMFLNRGIRGVGIYRVLYYIPSLLGSSVAIAVLWLQVFGSEGIFNAVLGLFSIEGQSWIGNPDSALYTIIVLAVWTFGSTMVIFLAGLRQIPVSYYEAAQIDGASKWQQFWTITFPHLTPVIFFNGLLTIVNSLQSFTPAYVVSGGTGQPADSLLLYTVYLYQKGFVDFQMGYASAMAWVLLIALAVVAGGLFWSSRYWVFYGEDS